MWRKGAMNRVGKRAVPNEAMTVGLAIGLPCGG